MRKFAIESSFTMKILHTSDWHLGHTLYNYDRREEQQQMLRQMVRIASEQQPDVFLLCGDVYHTPQPSAAVQTMLANALLALHKACPAMTIVMTAGNHDSGSKHEIFQLPWRELGVYAVGQVERDHPERHLIEVPGKGHIVAVPYCASYDLRPKGEATGDNLFGRLMALAAAQNTDGLPVVLTAHTTVAGCDASGHDNATDRLVGGIDALPLEQMGTGYDYLALGHIHRAQFVDGSSHRARYCGTPLPVSFDERYAHSVSIVTIEAHGRPPVVQTVPVDNPHPLVTLPTEGFAPWAEALQLLARFPDDVAAYIRLNVEVEGFLPQEAQAEAARTAEGKQCRFCCINVNRKPRRPDEAKTLSVQEFRHEAPIDIARRYAADMGLTFDDDMEQMFGQIVRTVEEERRNQ